MLLILADQFDVHADIVQHQLTQLGYSLFRLNLDKASLQATYITFEDMVWHIRTPSGFISLDTIDQVWLRRAFVEIPLEESDESDPNLRIWRSEWNKTLSGMYLDLDNIPWLNPLREAFRAENKYLQMRIARRVGLSMPDTLVSNDKDQLISFAVKHGEVALKLMTQDLFVQKDGTVKGIYVNKLTAGELGNFSTDSENPIVLQAYISKSYEVRYTVVGDTHLVCKIDSQQSKTAMIDWRRYDIPRTPHSIIEPPSHIRTKVSALMKELGLVFGALDFVISGKDEWFFLEINPTGQWLWIEDLTGLPIATALVNWFTKPID